MVFLARFFKFCLSPLPTYLDHAESIWVGPDRLGPLERGEKPIWSVKIDWVGVGAAPRRKVVQKRDKYPEIHVDELNTPI